MRGRPAKLTQDVIDIVVEKSRAVSLVSAAGAVGLSYDTIKRWRAHGRDCLAAWEQAEEAGQPYEPSEHDLLCMDLHVGISEAVDGSEVDMSLIVQRAAQDDWRAASWFLESRFGARWGRKRLELTGAEGGPITLATITEKLREDEEHAKSVEDADCGGSLD